MQRAINQFASLNTPRAVLHDEFRRLDAAEWQKRVWVQNSGNSPFIARISASEFMQWIEAEDWTRGRNIIEGIPFADPIPAAIETTLTPTLDSDTWGVDGTLIDTQTAWFNVTADMWSIRGLTDPTSLTQAAPARGHAADGMPFSEYWDWDSDHLTYSEWTALPLAQRSNKWVLADDGFFYYTSVIRPETNTLPLMTGVSAATGFDPLRAAFYYAIDIQMEVVTQEDISAMKDGLVPSSGTDGVSLRAASTQGKAILDAINWTAPVIGRLLVNGSDDLSITVPFGASVTLEVDAGGDPDLTYLWQTTNSPWNDAPGTNDETEYTVDTTTPGIYEFRVLVSNSGNAPVEDDGHTTASDTITVEVEPSPVPTPVTPVRRDFGPVQFFKIAEQTVGGVTYDLLVTRYVYGANPTAAWANVLFNASGQGNFWLTNEAGTGQSTVIAGMDSWYNGLTGAELDSGTNNLKSLAVQADFTGSNAGAGSTRTFGTEGLTGHPDVRVLAGTTNADVAANIAWMQDPENYPEAISTPSSRAAASATSSPSTGQGIVAFPLSGKEILSYFTNIGTGTATGPSVLAPLAHGIGANHAGATTARQWWSRSRGHGATTAGGVDTNGNVYGSWGVLLSNGTWDDPNGNTITNPSFGLRPAIWVRQAP
ncbi:MAG: hypothetical protein FWG78_03100 [Coriobacteriia bacterium]|nr:hypothetical protein [Coriobacteriia bacterium]